MRPDGRVRGKGGGGGTGVRARAAPGLRAGARGARRGQGPVEATRGGGRSRRRPTRRSPQTTQVSAKFTKIMHNTVYASNMERSDSTLRGTASKTCTPGPARGAARPQDSAPPGPPDTRSTAPGDPGGVDALTCGRPRTGPAVHRPRTTLAAHPTTCGYWDSGAARPGNEAAGAPGSTLTRHAAPAPDRHRTCGRTTARRARPGAPGAPTATTATTPSAQCPRARYAAAAPTRGERTRPARHSGGRKREKPAHAGIPTPSHHPAHIADNAHYVKLELSSPRRGGVTRPMASSNEPPPPIPVPCRTTAPVPGRAPHHPHDARRPRPARRNRRPRTPPAPAELPPPTPHQQTHKTRQARPFTPTTTHTPPILRTCSSEPCAAAAWAAVHAWHSWPTSPSPAPTPPPTHTTPTTPHPTSGTRPWHPTPAPTATAPATTCSPPPHAPHPRKTRFNHPPDTDMYT